MTEGPTQDPSLPSREIGWHPDRVVPSLQKYWDGTDWSAQRRWLGGQWVAEPVGGSAVPPRVPPGTPPPGFSSPGASSSPYRATSSAGYGAAPFGARASRTAGSPALTLGVIGLAVCGILLIVGSVTPWITVNVAVFSASASGTDSAISNLIGVNGWITLAGGVVLLVFAGMATVSDEATLRTASLVVATVVTGFAIYDLVRIVQKVSEASPGRTTFGGSTVNALQASAGVGWGLIVVVIAAIGAFICAIAEARSAS